MLLQLQRNGDAHQPRNDDDQIKQQQTTDKEYKDNKRAIFEKNLRSLSTRAQYVITVAMEIMDAEDN